MRKNSGDTLDAVTIAQDVRGHPIRLRIRGSHTLIIGLTGSGKGSAIASIVAGLCRCHQPWELNFIDLKRGTEAAYYDAITTRHAFDAEETEALLDDLLKEVRRRADELRGTTRNLEPSERYPLQVLAIDEAAELGIAYGKDEKTRAEKITRTLDELLRLGRAWGFCCLAATQDPRVEAFKLRPRFPQRLCLRVNDESEGRMCLGAHAVELGATPWLLPSDKPGSCWGFNSETGEVERFRFLFYTDDEIRQLRKCRA